MTLSKIILGGVMSCMVALPLLAQNPQAASVKPASTAPTKTAAEGQGGQKVFEQNCSRCHESPKGFSSRVSGTVSHHMQARANLSKAELDALLRFFNP
jgi:mono/diheme cytochrome c family protein